MRRRPLPSRKPAPAWFLSIVIRIADMAFEERISITITVLCAEDGECPSAAVFP